MMERSALPLTHLQPRRCVESVESCVCDCSGVKAAQAEVKTPGASFASVSHLHSLSLVLAVPVRSNPSFFTAAPFFLSISRPSAGAPPAMIGIHDGAAHPK